MKKQKVTDKKQKVTFRLAYYTFICKLWDNKRIKLILPFKEEEVFENREKERMTA